MPLRKPNKEVLERAARAKKREARDALITEDIKSGKLLYMDIAKKHKVAQSHVTRIAERAGLPQRRPRGPRRKVAVSVPNPAAGVFQIERAAVAVPAALAPSGFPWGDMRVGDSVFVPAGKAGAVMMELPERVGFAADVEPGGVRIRRNS